MEKILNAFVLMRIPFSIFLMPIFWFSLLVVNPNDFNWIDAGIIFFILHVLVYPASNGYNSYFDKDEGSIGGLEKPPKVNETLFYLVVVFDLLAVVLSLYLSWHFAVSIFIYLLVSKAYSWDKIRLKKYAITSTVIVTLFQGAFTFLAVIIAFEGFQKFGTNEYLLALVSTLFLAGSYPITQIYQHEEDSKRGDKTISLMLGIKGTFVFSGLLFAIAVGLMSFAFIVMQKPEWLLIFAISTAPILFFFANWGIKSFKDTSNVNFHNTMKMNKISSICLSVGFFSMKLFDILT